MKDRLMLFNATVTPTVLYGCGCWVMIDARERKLRTTQRRMLRWIVGVGRRKATSHEDDESVNKELEEGGEASSEATSNKQEESLEDQQEEQEEEEEERHGWSGLRERRT